MREAAKSVGLWDTAPLLEDISTEMLRKFRETVKYMYGRLLGNIVRVLCMLSVTYKYRHAIAQRIIGANVNYSKQLFVYNYSVYIRHTTCVQY